MDIATILQKPHTQRHFSPLKSAPDGWPRDGKFFPLGPESAVKSDWDAFWSQVAVAMHVIAAHANNPLRDGKQMSAEETMQDMIVNLRTHILATVFCPAWNRSWATMLLGLVTECVNRCEDVTLIARKGGPACDEECEFTIVLMQELGFQRIRAVRKQDINRRMDFVWQLDRKDANPCYVQLLQFAEIEDEMWRPFAAAESNRCVPHLKRIAVISCAAEWFIDGKPVRINPDEVDDAHPEGMTMNDKLNAVLLHGLRKLKEIAKARGFRPMDSAGNCIAVGHAANTPEQEARAQAYFADVPDA